MGSKRAYTIRGMAALFKKSVKMSGRLYVSVENLGRSPGENGVGVTDTAAAAQPQVNSGGSTQSSSVGFTCPPTASSITLNNVSGSGYIDYLEDQFCWTIVTISCTEVSYIDANSPSAIEGKRADYPHLPCSPLPGHRERRTSKPQIRC